MAVAGLERIGTRTDERRRSDLIQLRRQLSDHIGQLNDLIVAIAMPAFAGPTAEDFRARWSTMRTILAVHQASFPAVLLDSADESYRTSGARVSAKIRETVALVRATAKQAR